MTGIYRHITVSKNQDVLIITVDLKEVKDYMIAEELRYEMVHAIQKSGLRKFALDLLNMEFITSLACVAFIGLKHAARDLEGRLVLCNLSDFLRKVFNAKRLLTPSATKGNVAFHEAADLATAIALLTAPDEGVESSSTD